MFLQEEGKVSVHLSHPLVDFWQPQTASGFVAKSRKLPVFELCLIMVEQCEALVYDICPTNLPKISVRNAPTCTLMNSLHTCMIAVVWAIVYYLDYQI